ncbi:hypothetical protein EDC04DRAFT_2557905, partial [Pisolithus marmoratus]
TEQTLTTINNALNCFHLYREVFQNAEVVMMFSLPQQHAMKHYPYTNCFQALGQMLLINQRLDKLAAAHVDFQDHSMLTGTCLSDVIGTQGMSIHLGLCSNF